MQKDGEKNAETQDPAGGIRLAGHDGAGQRNAVGQRVQRHAHHRRRPGKGNLAFGERLFMMMGREEPLDQEQRQQPEGDPQNGRGFGGQTQRLGQHVKQRRTEGHPGGEAQIDLQLRMAQSAAQRQQAAGSRHHEDRAAVESEEPERRQGGSLSVNQESRRTNRRMPQFLARRTPTCQPARRQPDRSLAPCAGRADSPGGAGTTLGASTADHEKQQEDDPRGGQQRGGNQPP